MRCLGAIDNVDAFISTFPIIGYVLDRRRTGHPETKLVTVITDAGAVNKIWFGGLADMFIVSDVATIRYAEKLGISQHRIALAEAPIIRAADAGLLSSKGEARRILGLEDEFTVLLTAGSEGLGRGVLAAAAHLASSGIDVQLLLNAGRNNNLYRKFVRLSEQRNYRLFGFTNQFQLLLAASDLVVGKAGWLTLNEAMAMRRPTLVVDVLPGQEDSNCTFAEIAGIARRVSPGEVPTLVERYAQDRASLDREFNFYQTQAALHGWPSQLRAALHLVLPLEGR
jgi:processive 1,2-diacylglycerol beta-glucosyltransferase